MFQFQALSCRGFQRRLHSFNPHHPTSSRWFVGSSNSSRPLSWDPVLRPDTYYEKYFSGSRLNSRNSRNKGAKCGR